MRIKAIQLSWFRGAADPVFLEPNCKSMVVYGMNASGKSSFVDAVEYVLNDGKIGHLAHEYSGKRQERAVPNTHKPDGKNTELRITFNDGSELKKEIQQDGVCKSSGAEAVGMDAWDYQRTVLRQDEVAAFIHDTKGGKYSALLPLLGLHKIEVAAENLRQLAKYVENVSKLRETKASLTGVEAKQKATFGAKSDVEIKAKIEGLHAKYCGAEAGQPHRQQLETAIDARIAASSADERLHVALRDVAALDLKGNVNVVRLGNRTLTGAVEPLISEKLEVLQSTRAFVDKLEEGEGTNCPACGRSIPVSVFQAHVTAERERLGELIKTFETRKAAIGTLCDTVRLLKSNLGKSDVQSWRDEASRSHLADNFAYLDGISVEALRVSCGEQDLQAFEDKLQPLVDDATLASKDAPHNAQQLSKDKQAAQVGSAVDAAKAQVATIKRAEALISFIHSLEQGIREEIRLRSQTVMREISANIQSMWAILHPGAPIEDVHLCLPNGTDKAIDIGLRFHGVEQGSPRLTLSEGYRNSLGLCIFLAMANRQTEEDRPLFLDDVVVSLDRNHRGMIAELLEKKFNGRQVIILTHDRDWYTELRQQIDSKNWLFKALLPYETPEIGIRWSHATTTFGDARAQISDRPDAAGNDARKIMDVELALIAERLQTKLPYMRGDKNDKRLAHTFLERLVADGKKCFQKKAGDDYAIHTDAIDALDKADQLLISWGNRASHTFDLVRPEATKLIDTCEKALKSFKCLLCGKDVWVAKMEGSKSIQCQCGQIRWRYGKV